MQKILVTRVSMSRIKLSAEQVRDLLVKGECSVVGNVYEVSSVGMFVRFDENGLLRAVDAPKKRPVGRPSRVVIRSKEKEGVFIDKAHKFLVGDVTDAKDGRMVEILRVEVKPVSAITDDEWHSMGCNWSDESLTETSKRMHLSFYAFSMDDEVGLYWYKDV